MGHTENDQQLHQDDGNEQTVDHDVPDPTTGLHPCDVDEHELVLVDPRADPHDKCCGHGNQRGQGSENKTDSGHEELYVVSIYSS